MNYKIRVEGGFTGIPRVYQGSIHLSSDEVEDLVSIMTVDLVKNGHLRDGLTYNVELSDENQTLKGVFDEKNVPKIFHKLISGETKNFPLK